eukprot:339247-Amphidinium_carterae.1
MKLVRGDDCLGSVDNSSKLTVAFIDGLMTSGKKVRERKRASRHWPQSRSWHEQPAQGGSWARLPCLQGQHGELWRSTNVSQ